MFAHSDLISSSNGSRFSSGIIFGRHLGTHLGLHSMSYTQQKLETK